MKKIIFVLLLIFLLYGCKNDKKLNVSNKQMEKNIKNNKNKLNSVKKEVKMSEFYNFKAVSIDKKEVSMSKYKGKAILVVNVASKCGFTPQYEGLESLYEKYKDKGLVILGFPSNQFAHQEPGTNEEIASFCKLNYGVTFPLFNKIDVNGNNAHPIYKYLKKEQSGLLGGTIKWNFTKFLINKDGKVIKRYAPNFKPKGIEKDIVKLLD